MRIGLTQGAPDLFQQLLHLVNLPLVETSIRAARHPPLLVSGVYARWPASVTLAIAIAVAVAVPSVIFRFAIHHIRLTGVTTTTAAGLGAALSSGTDGSTSRPTPASGMCTRTAVYDLDGLLASFTHHIFRRFVELLRVGREGFVLRPGRDEVVGLIRCQLSQPFTTSHLPFVRTHDTPKHLPEDLSLV